VRRIDGSEIDLVATGTWTSPATGTTWPSGWRLAIASIGLAATIDPEIPDQELDTRESTGVVYWEGASSVRGSLAGRPIAGQAYVELTGYAR
jgi:predicted secreted hydrolase